MLGRTRSWQFREKPDGIGGKHAGKERTHCTKRSGPSFADAMGTNLPPIFLHVSPVCVTRAGAHEGARYEHARYGRPAPAQAGYPVEPAWGAMNLGDASTWGAMNLRRHAPRKRGIQYSRHIETFEASCPAKAGHPVLPAYRDRRALVGTGSSACADDDASTWGVTNLRRHAPRKRGIQYSRHVETDGRS